MAGIQVHTSSPINTNTATKSRETTAEPTSSQDVPTYVAATTTAYAQNATHTAQPGASAVPAPSAAATAYAPPSPTRTTAPPAVTSPPPPQPGQVPQPFAEQTRTGPPPPTASQLPQQQFVPPQGQQTRYPPPVPRLWTSTYPYTQSPAGVTSVAQDLSHPPGYVQHHQSFDDRYVEPENRSHTPSPTTAGRGILDTEPVLRNASDDESNPMWDTAVSWAKEAGRKLSVVEGEVWKKLNGDK